MGQVDLQPEQFAGRQFEQNPELPKE